MKFGIQRRPDPMIDVSPMIDVVFQLVLFFMVSTTFVSAPGIEVDLPKSGADAVLSDKQEIDIWMTVEGAVYIDDEPVDVSQLRGRLQQAAETDPSTLVIIKADAGVQHGRVVGVMDMARALGLSRLAIATESPAAGGGRDSDEGVGG